MMRFKNRFVVATLVASLLIALGGIIGWYKLEGIAQLVSRVQIDGKDLQSNISTKATVSIVFGLVSAMLTVVIARFGRRFLGIIVVLLSGFMTLATFNQLSGKQEAESLGVIYLPGFWLSLIGSFATLVSAIGMIVTVKRQKSDPTAMPFAPSVPSQQVMTQANAGQQQAPAVPGGTPPTNALPPQPQAGTPSNPQPPIQQ